MRIAEALGLDIDKHISGDGTMIKVRCQVKITRIVEYLKTGAAWREIDLCPELAALLLKYIGDRKGLLFPSKTGQTPMAYANIRRRWLHPKLKTLKLYKDGAGMHIFRRFRSAHLRKNRCPEDLRQFWLGHENSDISDHYAEHLLFDMARRREWAAKIGMGIKAEQGPTVSPHNNQVVNAAVPAASQLIN